MKGMVEEYGTFIITGVIAIILISTLLTSMIRPTGEIHQFIVNNMKNVGAESTVIIDEWDINSDIKAEYKDDGGLYITGEGSLPNYVSVESTPWADYAGDIAFIDIDNDITISGTVPIK